MARTRPRTLCGAALLLLLACALLLALRAACSRATDITLPARLPVNFFPTTSPVQDLFLGQLDRAEDIRRDSEVTLFFFYAPWCGQSVAVRGELEKVARRLADQVLFVAINCWWNQGKCRKQKHFFYFPVIYLYHQSFGPIEYKGPMTADYLEKFVRRVMTPLLYISSRSRLRQFLSNYEPGLLGFFEFNASPQPPGYLTFFASALHSLDKDHLGTIHFGVITDKLLAKEIPLTSSGSLYLHRSVNASLLYPQGAMNYTAENVCRWALENRELFLRWLWPHGGKSLLLHHELKKGPALFLFLPFDPLGESQPRVEEISRLALEYHNCNRSRTGDGDPEGPQRGAPPPAGLRPPQAASRARCCHTVVLPPQWLALPRTHNVCELCVNQTAGLRPSRLGGPQCSFLEMEAALDSFYLQERPFLRVASRAASLCSHFLGSYSPFSRYSACCRTVEGAPPGQTLALPLQEAVAPRGEGWPAERPERPAPRTEDGRRLLPERPPLRGAAVAGLSCRTNRTLNLYLLDSNLFWLLAERLGAPSALPGQEFAAIVDLKEEAHYVLGRSLRRSSLESFIRDFSAPYSPLRRHLAGGEGPGRVQGQRLVQEVATDTFRETVLRTEKDVLLLYYAPWCGFCTSLNHVFIQLARTLPPESFVVARIDVSRNDLPWEFVTDRLPHVLVFPRGRKDQSVPFPADLPLSLPNLLKFALRHSSGLPPAPGPDPCPQDGLRQGRISHLERELQQLRAEVRALHQAQAQLQGRLSEARREEQRLQQESRALQSHRQHLQELYDRKTRQLQETAGKLQALAEASESLLAENRLLQGLVASVERKLGGPKAELEISLPQEEAGLAVPAVDSFREADKADGSAHLDARLASEHSKENWTE